MDTKIKICGLKTEEDIEIINQLEIDYIGFVFADSKRKVTPKQAKVLREKLNPNIKAVGVFLNEKIDKVNEIARFCNLDLIQLHGNETNQYCSNVIKPVWKVLPISTLIDINKHKKYTQVDGILLDTLLEGIPGGSGKSFNWEIAKHLYRERFTVLAGGLSPSNVKEAINIVKPHVVDVSSGVEVDGVKNLNKIIEFIRSVEKYEY